jgi:hypothetical protein
MKKIKEFFRDVNLRVILINSFMTLMVVAIAGVMLLATMGYGIDVGEEVRIERVGMLRIRSSPSRADIYIDGEKTSYRTDFTRTMSEGDYEVELKKEGYMGWKRKIKITAGMLQSFEYPRLFPVKMEPEAVAEYTAAEIVVSKDRRRLLVTYGAEEGNFIRIVDIAGGGYSARAALAGDEEVRRFLEGRYEIVSKEVEDYKDETLTVYDAFFVQREDGTGAVQVRCDLSDFAPVDSFTNHLGKLAVFRGENGEFCVYDVEDKKPYNYSVEGVEFGGWLDDYMFWGRKEGAGLVVWDFDGKNQRTILKDAGGTIGFATIEEGGRFLYYSVVGEDEVQVFRQKLH